jgi:hypothetical protein
MIKPQPFFDGNTSVLKKIGLRYRIDLTLILFAVKSVV